MLPFLKPIEEAIEQLEAFQIEINGERSKFMEIAKPGIYRTG